MTIHRIPVTRNRYDDGWTAEVRVRMHSSHQGHVCNLQLGKLDRADYWFAFATSTVISAHKIDGPAVVTYADGDQLDIGGTLYKMLNVPRSGKDPQPVMAKGMVTI